MLKLISFKICPFVQRITALLDAKKLPYEIEYISLSDKPQWFTDISPTGQVPLLVTDSGLALFESDAIAEYIDEISKPLEAEVTPEQRAIDRAWSYQGTKHYLAQCSTMRSKDKATLNERMENLTKAFTKAEAQITAGPFFKGEQLSNVDIAWLPLLHRAAIINKHTGFDMLEGFPRVQGWQQAVMNSGHISPSVAEDFEQVFTDFYLSEQTYLGRGADCQQSSDCSSLALNSSSMLKPSCC